MEIKGKTIFITGGAKRIGAFLACEFAKLGANLVIHYNSSEGVAKKLKEECESFGVSVQLVRSDFSEKIPDDLRVYLRSSDILICNASRFEKINIEDITEEDIIRSLKIEFIKHFLLVKELWREAKRKNKFAKVITILDAQESRRDFLTYHFGKKLMEYMTEKISKFFAPYISINGVSIGVILPPESGGDIEKLVEKVPMKRKGELSEVFSAVKFLIENDYVTGQIIKVSGGL